MSLAEALLDLQELTRRLRRDCPWDREQTARTIAPHTSRRRTRSPTRCWRTTTRRCAVSSATSSSRSTSCRCSSRSGTRATSRPSPASCTRSSYAGTHVFGEAEAATAGQVRERWDELKTESEVARGSSRRPESLPADPRPQGAAPGCRGRPRLAGPGGAAPGLREETGELAEAVAHAAEPRPETEPDESRP